MDIEQMRIRMGEMAAEIERLQAVIEDANAQDPDCWRISHKSFCGTTTDSKEIAEDPFYAGHVIPLYSRPIPAQQSCAECGNDDSGLALYCVKCIDGIQQSPRLNFTVMQSLATLKTEVLGLEHPSYAIQLIERIEAEQQSPAVAVPDGLRELIAACRQIGFPVVTDGMRYVIDDMQSALRIVQNSIGAPSPRITEQDAREIAKSVANVIGLKESIVVGAWFMGEGRALLDKLNGKTESVGGL